MQHRNTFDIHVVLLGGCIRTPAVRLFQSAANYGIEQQLLRESISAFSMAANLQIPSHLMQEALS
jgi:hypothetical protein